MKTITAKVLDSVQVPYLAARRAGPGGTGPGCPAACGGVVHSTHLELSQPISAAPGESIQIAIPEEGDHDALWREAARQRSLGAYDEADSTYDRL